MCLYTGVFNECQTTHNNCDVNAVSTDLERGYTCTCRIGYTGDGTRCTKSSKLNYKMTGTVPVILFCHTDQKLGVF